MTGVMLPAPPCQVEQSVFDIAEAEACCAQGLDQGPVGSLPTVLSTTEAGSLLLRTGQKRFFFDTFSNANGGFFRITEVRQCSRRRRSFKLNLLHAHFSAWCFL